MSTGQGQSAGLRVSAPVSLAGRVVAHKVLAVPSVLMAAALVWTHQHPAAVLDLHP